MLSQPFCTIVIETAIYVVDKYPTQLTAMWMHLAVTTCRLDRHDGGGCLRRGIDSSP
jgi:hypothetical protein